jgi:hypothetical protein
MTEAPSIERAPEEVALFNAAFIALLVREAAQGHAEQQRDSLGLPLVLAYLIVPLALHKPTRDVLPRTVASQMHEWVQNAPLVRVGLADRVRALRPLVGSAVAYGVGTGVVTADAGRLSARRRKTKPTGLWFSQDFEECFKTARFLGRWFERQSDVATALAIWGLKP